MSPRAHVIRPVGTSHDRGRGVRTAYLVTREHGATAFVSGVTELDPGASLPFHSHNCEESVVVLAGRASFETRDALHELDAGEATWVPEGVVHRFVNAAQEQLRILWTYGSREPTRTIAETGETFPIGSARDTA